MKGRYERVDMEFARGALLSEVIRLVLQEELDVLRETITERGKLINETTEFPVELIRQQAPDVKVICGLPGEDTSLPLLHIAAATNCVQSIQCLLELGWNIDHQSPFTQSTPVLYAALNNHIDSVNCLLEYNCDINKRAEYYNVSDICSDERNISCDNEKPIDTVDEKMKNKVDISTRSEHNKTQINTYDHECIDELRNNPNEPKNCTSSGGVTPLVIGAQNPRIVFELLRRGAKVDTVCEYDRGSMHITALGVAIKAGQPESVKLLLQAGASVHSICEFNHTHTALDMAICCCKYPTDTKYLNNMAILVDLFISYGADPNIISHHKTLLQNLVVADRSVDVLMMSKLHNAGADVEGRCRPEGHTLLSMSVLHGKTEQVQMLLNKNCQVNYRVKLDKSECDQYTKNTPFSPIELSLFLSEKDIDWATSLLIWDPDFFLFSDKAAFHRRNVTCVWSKASKKYVLQIKTVQKAIT